jgi:hypothetical protein
MVVRIITFVVIIGAAYWYWSGPYQEKIHPSYKATVEENDRKMADCTRAAAYSHGATGTGPSAEYAEEECAEKYNLYELDGHWHSHDAVRPD